MDYCESDCIGSRSSCRAFVHQTFERALAGEVTSLHLIFTDHLSFGTSSDSEAWSEVPNAFLQELGDTRFADFLSTEPVSVQESILQFIEHDEPRFSETFPMTSKLYYIRISRKE